MEVQLLPFVMGCYFALKYFEEHKKEDDTSSLIGHMILNLLFCYFLPVIALLFAMMEIISKDD